jgi:O-acetyl-ADP-ribose deacetylase (regulator of RNase III)
LENLQAVKDLALQFRRLFPENFDFYEAACGRHEMRPGNVLVFETGSRTGPRFIVNFPTKRHWRDASRMEDVDAGLKSLVEEVRSRGIKSIAVPALGCGRGGLNWNVVRPRIERAFSGLPETRVILFEPPRASTTTNERSEPTPR